MSTLLCWWLLSVVMEALEDRLVGGPGLDCERRPLCGSEVTFLRLLWALCWHRAGFGDDRGQTHVSGTWHWLGCEGWLGAEVLSQVHSKEMWSGNQPPLPVTGPGLPPLPSQRPLQALPGQ